mmetsp:Transcript_8010/g.24957  ORF Transcript_8010/g.24957 Transcript_8010/m.24957 type:complete len:229 (+) Transcript_8010:587-1273(+)
MHGALLCVVARTDDKVAERVLHQHPLGLSPPSTESVAVRTLKLHPCKRLHAFSLTPRHLLLASSVPVVQIQWIPSDIFERYWVVLHISWTIKWLHGAIDKLWLQVALAVLQLDDVHMVLEQKLLVRRVSGPVSTRPEELPGKSTELFSYPGRQDRQQLLRGVLRYSKESNTVLRCIEQVEVGRREGEHRVGGVVRRKGAGTGAHPLAALTRLALRARRARKERAERQH